MEQDITEHLTDLEKHLDAIFSRVKYNSALLTRLQQFERHLLGLNSLAELIDYILNDSKSLLDLDIISLCLVDFNAEIAQYLDLDKYDYREKHSLFLLADDHSLQLRLGQPIRPFLGIYQTADFAGFFPELVEEPVSVVIVPLMRRGKCMGSLNLGSYQENRFTQKMATDFIQHIAAVISICFENNLNFEALRHNSLIDSLTGLNNRRFLEQRILEELERSRRGQLPLSCLFLDIDYFKHINDDYGHQAGDFVLAQVAAASKKYLRSNDVLARYGGEEFVGLLCDCDSKTAQEIAERIRINIQRLQLDYMQRPITVTISIGVATVMPDLTAQSALEAMAVNLIQQADVALYAAKRNGRNRIESSGVLSFPNQDY